MSVLSGESEGRTRHRNPLLRGPSRRWWVDLLVVGVYLALTVVVTWPLVAQLKTHFAGQDIDVWLNPWATWWTEKAITTGQDLYYTHALFYPDGVSLAFHSFFHVNSALALLFRPWLGDLGGHNAALILAHGLSGYGMFCLVRYLTRSPAGSFLAGLAFAFLPYRMAETVHPHLAATQWMPLYVLFLLRLLDENNRWHILPAAFFFALNGLAGWHLMTLAAILSLMIVGYPLLVERRPWSWAPVINLALLALLVGLILAPLLYPIVREQLVTTQSYVGVPLDTGRGNDLIAFFLPPQGHVLWKGLVEPVHARVQTKRSAYLGFVLLGLSVFASLTNWKQARFWILVALLSVLLSIGPYVQINGHKTGILVPWSIPIVWLLRYVFRFNMLIGFALAVTGGLGLSIAMQRLSAVRPATRWLFAGVMMGLLLFEFLCLPFPTTEEIVPEYYVSLADGPGSGAIVELPMGRHRTKYYMYYQRIHERSLVEGHVSRPPAEAYATIEATPILRSFRACKDWVLPPADVTPLLGELNALGIDHVIVHKDLVTPKALALWLETRGSEPDYEDETLAVYVTRPDGPNFAEGPQLLESCIGVQALLDRPVQVAPGDVLDLPLQWTAGTTPEEDYVLELVLTSRSEGTEHRYRYRVIPGLSIATWPMTSQRVLRYSLPVGSQLDPGSYRVAARLLPTKSDPAGVLSAPVLELEVVPASVGTGSPAAEATFGPDLHLYGYDLVTEQDALHLSLRWQALRKMTADYKIFLHLYEADSGTLAAQVDVMPREWTYPTSWWQSREVVFDTVTLPVGDVPPGRYRLAIGVYDSLTGERLPVSPLASTFSVDEGRLILPEEIVP